MRLLTTSFAHPKSITDNGQEGVRKIFSRWEQRLLIADIIDRT
jgi:hypothetical protein